MDTVDKLAAYCKEHEIEDIHVMGAPKTIDNDLVGTDHCQDSAPQQNILQLHFPSWKETAMCTIPRQSRSWK